MGGQRRWSSIPPHRTRHMDQRPACLLSCRSATPRTSSAQSNTIMSRNVHTPYQRPQALDRPCLGPIGVPKRSGRPNDVYERWQRPRRGTLPRPPPRTSVCTNTSGREERRLAPLIAGFSINLRRTHEGRGWAGRDQRWWTSIPPTRPKMLREDPRLTCFAETRCVIPPSDQKQEAPCQHLTCPHHPPDHHPSIVRDEEERLGAGCAAGVLHLDEEERGARHRRAGFNADDVLETCCDATARASPLASARLPSLRFAPPFSSISTRRSAGRVNVVQVSQPTTCSRRVAMRQLERPR